MAGQAVAAMKLPPFEYRSVESADEAASLLADHGDEAKVLAGGQSLLPLMALRLGRPEVLVDVNPAIELGGLDRGADGGLMIGSMTRHRHAERMLADDPAFSVIARALRHVGHDAIRVRGTIGGSIAHADPAAEMPMVISALDGRMHTMSADGARVIEAADFFEGFLTTALEPTELLRAIELPAPPPRRGWSFGEVSRRSGDFAIVGAAVAVGLDEAGAIDHARIVLSGVSDVPLRATDAEAVLVGAAADGAGGWDATCEAAAQAAGAQIDPTSDLHGSAEFRRHLTRGLVRSGVREALEQASGGAR